MLRLVALVFLLLCVAPISTVHAVTRHMDMTPELVDENGFEMKALGNGRTQFTVRRDTSDDPKHDARFPFVRRGRLDVYGDEGLIARCQVEPTKGAKGLVTYRFELHDAHAKAASFTIVEFVDDKQVGGGAVFSYRLLDFIDPQHRWKELVDGIDIPKIGKVDLGSRRSK